MKRMEELKPGQMLECDPEKMQIVPPDPNMKEMIKDIMHQNEMVLKMNAELMSIITHPMWLVSNETDQEVK